MTDHIEPGRRRPPAPIQPSGCPPPADLPLAVGGGYDLRKPEAYAPAFVAAGCVLAGLALLVLFVLFLRLTW